MSKNILNPIGLALFLYLGLWPLASWGQSPSGHVRRGNEAYGKEDYPGADVHYRKALDANNNDYKAQFNLGNALYRQENYTDAETKYQSAAETAEHAADKASALYNLGNAQLKQKKYGEAIESYEQSLRLNPGNPSAMYNLAYAKQMLDKQQKGQNNNNKEQDNDKEQNKDNKGEDQEKEQNQGGGDNKEREHEQDEGQQDDKKNEGNNGPKEKGDKGEENTSQQAPQDMGISPADARKLLEALEGEEKKVQAKIMERKGKGTKQKAEKEW
ncbi:MAG: tetratricopeptide repeat protein [Bacteroidetes bacterium]|jgi:tetratricopeptide (TPR) repeat protein|nr:tetratricopeptide repeat protein [Bacteroidota bacterium]